MIKVLYILSTLNTRGPVIVLLNIIKYLDREKFEPYIISLSPNDSKSLLPELKKYTKKIIALDLSRIKGIFKAKKMLTSHILSIKPEIIHTHGIRSDHLNSSIHGEAKKVATLHNYPYHDYVLTYGRIKGSIMSYRHLKTLYHLDQPVAVSNSILSKLGDKFNYFHVIQNGIDDAIFNKGNSSEKRILRSKLELSDHQIVFLVTGHLSKRKNPLTIIKAFNNVDIDNSVLIFCGDGELENECQNFAKGNRILFKGRVNNISEYLKAADYFISASKAEGLPNAVLEAMSCGLPVVLSNIPPHTEIFENNRYYDYFFDPEDWTKLSFLLNKIVNSDYKSLSGIVAGIISTNFTAEIMSNKYQTLYLKLLN